jgi:tetratricopeptide (TPR) repeat protein
MDYYTQGRYYRRIGQTAKAILHLKRSVELNPKWFDYRVALANAYYALGRLDSTAEQLRAALQFNPGAPDVREFLDIVMARMSAGQAARE